MVSPNGSIFVSLFETLKMMSSGICHVNFEDSNQFVLFKQSLNF